jgi:23S rRNA (cytidine1920-2'-O)/16S rRNA (cytidine1409-2'-O)-methyltransferase
LPESRARLDALLVDRGLAESRQKAQALILAGAVRVRGEVVTKAGTRYAFGEHLSVEDTASYASRAGEKLAFALDEFGVAVEGRSCLDAGASTGGFTDVLLRRGAERVMAVDVGYGQLDWRLRSDSRVTVMERTNVRRLVGEHLPFKPDLLVADLSFISLDVALRGLLLSTTEIVEAVVLVKPQFEAGPEEVGRGGLVRDPDVHERVLLTVIAALEDMGFGAVGVGRSPVAGRRSGNREYPMHLIRGEASGSTHEMVRRSTHG